MSFIKAVFHTKEEEMKINTEKTHEIFETHGAQSERLHAEWDRSKKPTNFWKCRENQLIYQRKTISPNYYTMGYDVETGEKIKANCVESALYIAKKRAAAMKSQ
ncbi:uncharacterized protein [Blastocystis hominis]|uniref:Uncharacterized protein n=1 Tax=Blastocystis hominis TaxID=12968 RepID=D8LZR3_BLAHO|nr:uncharacterized protein [Blastocystis hominis]CBK21302.2 unnamed protein product [Blastocystis hominis]|eukprot:XP_012895350.1 uncharacterized protein [Blastocystis hominis]